MQTKPQTFALPRRRPTQTASAAFAEAELPEPSGALHPGEPGREPEGDQVARFVLWLRDHYDPSFRVLLGAQAVGTEALRRLATDDMGEARWEALGLGDVLAFVQARSLPTLCADDMRLVGFALANYLYVHGHIGAGRRARLVRRARFAPLTQT